MAQKKVTASDKLLVIGGSAGSLNVLLRVLPGLKKIDFAIVIVVHRKVSNDPLLTELLSGKTKLNVKEVEEKELPLPGVIYLVPGDYHLLFESDKSFTLDYSEKVNYSRPSIDVVFQSAADVYADKLACILLSGANADGTEGLRHVKLKGGTTAAQQPATAEVALMPEHAIQNNVVDHILDIPALVSFINGF